MPNSRPVSPANHSSESDKDKRAAEALKLMREALKLLDENEGPHDAGAHLDDAINRLEEWRKADSASKD